jgi:N-acyl-D-aspartate/D-glutamate deacylase
MLAALIDNRLIHPDGGAPLIGGEAVRITSTPAQRAYEGRTLAEIATTLDLDVVAAAERVVDEVGLAAMVVIESMDEADVREVMRQPYTMIGSDGVMGPGTPHPRVFGTFPRVLGRYARDGVLELADAVHRMTGLPAATFGLIGRGAVTVGAFADLVVLDPAAVVDRGTFDQPDQAPAGICEVLVNGRRAVADGALTQARAGIALRRA